MSHQHLCNLAEAGYFNVDNDDFDAKKFRGYEYLHIEMRSEWEPDAPSKSVVVVEEEHYNVYGELADFDCEVTDIWSCEVL